MSEWINEVLWPVDAFGHFMRICRTMPFEVNILTFTQNVISWDCSTWKLIPVPHFTFENKTLWNKQKKKLKLQLPLLLEKKCKISVFAKSNIQVFSLFLFFLFGWLDLPLYIVFHFTYGLNIQLVLQCTLNLH